MGLLFSALWSRISSSAAHKICIVGLDAAGKTTILYKLELGEFVKTAPTIGSNVEVIKHRNLQLNMWDLGGQSALRPTWRTYFINTDAIILVVDSADYDRLDLAREELHAMLQSEDLAGAYVLVYANKQDLPEAASAAELSETLALHSIRDHDWHIQACSALNGTGLYDGLDWVTDRLKNKSAT